MCGIMGCISNENATPLIMEGLRRESYRGYDSSGINIAGSAFKAVGTLEELEKHVAEKNPEGTWGIGHNRWATHGEVTENNTHPHHDCTGKISIVHNGIIENYSVLKKRLTEEGHTFTSNTDSEVLAHLIEHFYKDQNLDEAVRSALSLVQGTYGLIVMASDQPDTLIAARLASPLVLGIKDGVSFVASDQAALNSYVDEFVILDDGDVATIKPGYFEVNDVNNRRQYKTATTLEATESDTDKGDFPHFMLKEIHEQSESLRNTLRGRVSAKTGTVKLGGLHELSAQLAKINRLQIVACGTASYAGMYAAYVLEEIAGIPASREIASEFRYRNPIINPETAMLVISQSGETADTLEALRIFKDKGGTTFGIVNTIGSAIAREVDAGLYNHVGPEIGVASTKAFTSQLVLSLLLAIHLGRLHNNLSHEEAKQILTELETLPEKIAKFIPEQTAQAKSIAADLAKADSIIYVGRKYQYPMALEGALKIKEVSYVHAEGYGAGELKHGALALIDQKTPTVALAPQDSVYEKTISNLHEIKSRSGEIIAIASEGDKHITDIADKVIYTPSTLEILSPIVTAIPLQLIAYYTGVARGFNVDKPRNLAKSVTVE